MSSWGEKQDRRDERMRGDLKAIQDGFQKSQTGMRRSVSKRKEVRNIIIGFFVFLVLPVIFLILLIAG